MPNYRRSIMFYPFFLILLLLSHRAYGYIDPGTTSAIFAILAPLISILAVVLGFLIRPFRRLVRSLIDRFRANPKSETDEQSASDNLLHHHGDGKDTPLG